MGSNAQIPKVAKDDWVRLNRVLRQLAFAVVGPDSTPTFNGLVLTGDLAVAGDLTVGNDLTVAGTITGGVITDGIASLTGGTGTGYTLASPVITGNWSWTSGSTWNLSGGSKTIEFAPTSSIIIEDSNGRNFLRLRGIDNDITFGNATDNTAFIFDGTGIANFTGPIEVDQIGPNDGTDPDLIQLATGQVDVNGDLFAEIVGVGASDADSTLYVEIMDVNKKGLLIKSAVGQVDNPFQINDSDGTVVMALTKSGSLQIAGASITMNPSAGTDIFIEIDKPSVNKKGNLRWSINSVDKWWSGFTDSGNFGNGDEYFIGATAGGANSAFLIRSTDMINIRAGLRVGDTTAPTHGLEVAGETLLEDALHIKEITTPTPIAGHGTLWTNAANELRMFSGDGVEHLVHGSAFSNIWFHGLSSSAVNIINQNEFAKVEIFDVVGDEDDETNAVGSSANNEIVIGTNGAGSYEIGFNASITAQGATRTFVLAAGIEFAALLDVTAATNASPIVVTVVGHPFKKGDMVTLAGATTNTAANGDWFVTTPTADTFELYDMGGAASTGNGVYDASSGDITHCYAGNVMMHRSVNQTAVGFGGPSGDVSLLVGDKISVYALNLDAATDLNVFQVSLHINREDD